MKKTIATFVLAVVVTATPALVAAVPGRGAGCRPSEGCPRFVEEVDPRRAGRIADTT